MIIAFWVIPPGIGNLGIVTPVHAEQPKLTKEQAAAVAAYDKALAAFKKILAERRAQIDALQAPAQKPAKKQAKIKALPSLPGQAIYLARLKVMSTYKDLTDVLPARIGRPNKFSVPPAYFEAGIEPLIEEYAELFRIMQAPPAYAQSSETPLRDVVQLGTAIARAKGADGPAAERAGLIALGIFFAETNARQNIGNARSNTYKGSLQTGPTEDRNGRRQWAAIKQTVAKLDPAVAARDDAEEARAAGIDQRFNHWTAVRNGLMNAHADLLEAIPSIVAMLPDEIDQMKLFQLIQIVPTPTRAALKSGDVAAYEISDRRIMGFLRNNSIFTFGRADRARKSATYREILDAMWLFNTKFEKARARFAAIKHGAAE
ncbi:MAG: hypothetical protein Q8K85_13855 [Hyphomicrobium sp.]|nr:hypothetical protein [Hyphomicrobium sp.]